MTTRDKKGSKYKKRQEKMRKAKTVLGTITIRVEKTLQRGMRNKKEDEVRWVKKREGKVMNSKQQIEKR